MLQQLSDRTYNIIPKPTASDGLEDKFVVSSASGEEHNQSSDRIQLCDGDDEKFDSDPEERDMEKRRAIS